MASELITAPANTWQRVGGKSGGTVSAIVAAPGSSAERVLYAGTMSGVYRSGDNGRTWTVSNEGLQSPFIQNLAIAQEPGSSPRLFAAAAGVGGFMSFGGVNWRRLDFWGVRPEIAAIAASPDFARDPRRPDRDADRRGFSHRQRRQDLERRQRRTAAGRGRRRDSDHRLLARLCLRPARLLRGCRTRSVSLLRRRSQLDGGRCRR